MMMMMMIVAGSSAAGRRGGTRCQDLITVIKVLNSLCLVQHHNDRTSCFPYRIRIGCCVHGNRQGCSGNVLIVKLLLFVWLCLGWLFATIVVVVVGIILVQNGSRHVQLTTQGQFSPATKMQTDGPSLWNGRRGSSRCHRRRRCRHVLSITTTNDDGVFLVLFHTLIFFFLRSLVSLSLSFQKDCLQTPPVNARTGGVNLLSVPEQRLGLYHLMNIQRFYNHTIWTIHLVVVLSRLYHFKKIFIINHFTTVPYLLFTW